MIPIPAKGTLPFLGPQCLPTDPLAPFSALNARAAAARLLSLSFSLAAGPPLNASRLPTFPKQTQEQNSTLKIQIEPSSLSLLTYLPNPPISSSMVLALCCDVEFVWEAFGEGIMSGFEARSNAVPIAPTLEERRKPGFERSIMYQRTGFTRNSVREAWRVDVQGSLR
jgi:hypothetical protein